MSDNRVKIILLSSITILAAIIVITIIYHTIFLLTCLNFIFGLVVLIWWLQKQLRITQHIIDLRETLFLCFELLVAGVSVYIFITKDPRTRIIVTQYAIAGIHLSALILLLIFMLTFKIKKLI